MSSILRAKRPTWSSVRERGRIPRREISPCVGLKPTTPQNAAGRIVEPVVWLPSASGTIPAATAAADPLDDPPGVCAGLGGLRVLPGGRGANPVVTVLPMITAPAARSIVTTAASRDGVRPACRTEPFSV